MRMCRKCPKSQRRKDVVERDKTIKGQEASFGKRAPGIEEFLAQQSKVGGPATDLPAGKTWAEKRSPSTRQRVTDDKGNLNDRSFLKDDDEEGFSDEDMEKATKELQAKSDAVRRRRR
jgi:hypothetical protein